MSKADDSRSSIAVLLASIGGFTVAHVDELFAKADTDIAELQADDGLSEEVAAIGRNYLAELRKRVNVEDFKTSPRMAAGLVRAINQTGDILGALDLFENSSRLAARAQELGLAGTGVSEPDTGAASVH